MKKLINAIKLFWFVFKSKDDYKVEDNSISDGYHTFKDLYIHRMLYNAAFAKLAKTQSSVKVFKSYKHSNGELCFGGEYFIVTMQLPTGQISNHYKVKDWKLFDVPYVPFAPKWDGHDTKVALDRLEDYVMSDNQYKIKHKDDLSLS